MRRFLEKICKKCGNKFIPSQWNQFYCGSKTKKTGCSYKEFIKKSRIYNNTKGKESIRKLQKLWMKKQRKNNTDYAVRQREAKREYAKRPDKKEIIKEWRHRNIKKNIGMEQEKIVGEKRSYWFPHRRRVGKP